MFTAISLQSVWSTRSKKMTIQLHWSCFSVSLLACNGRLSLLRLDRRKESGRVRSQTIATRAQTKGPFDWDPFYITALFLGFWLGLRVFDVNHAIFSHARQRWVHKMFFKNTPIPFSLIYLFNRHHKKMRIWSKKARKKFRRVHRNDPVSLFAATWRRSVYVIIIPMNVISLFKTRWTYGQHDEEAQLCVCFFWGGAVPFGTQGRHCRAELAWNCPRLGVRSLPPTPNTPVRS